MSTSRSRRAAEIQDAIRQTLFREWDPINIRDHEPAVDGYDRWIAPVYRIFAGSRSEDELLGLLIRGSDDLMGRLPRSPEFLRPYTGTAAWKMGPARASDISVLRQLGA